MAIRFDNPQGVRVIVSDIRPVFSTFHRKAHVNQINQLSWRPAENSQLQLASCSEDGILKIFDVQLEVG